MREINGKGIRDRGGSNFRPSRKAFRPPETHDKSVTALVLQAGTYSENLENGSEQDPILRGATAALNPAVPCLRQSLTQRQHLKLFQETELEQLKDTRRMQFDRKSGAMIETSDPNFRVVYKTPKTLLRRGNPFAMPNDFKRSTSRTKRIINERREEPLSIEVPTHTIRCFWGDKLVEYDIHESKIVEALDDISEWKDQPTKIEVVLIRK